MIKQLVLILSLLMFLFSCENKNTNDSKLIQEKGALNNNIDTFKIANKETSKVNIEMRKDSFSIDTFSVFPPEIKGCACYSSNNENEFQVNKYIYANDYGDNAFVSINGVMTKFKLIKVNQLEKKHTISKGMSEDKKFELIIDIKEIGEIDETWQHQGFLKLKHKDGKEIVKTIYGECGC